MGTDLYTGLPSNTWLIVFVVLWLIVMAGVVAVVADRHGRNGATWFLVSLLVTPVVALALLIMDTKPDRAPLLAGPRPEADAKPRGMPANTRPCPNCKAPVLRSRESCPSCGVRLVAGAWR